MFYLKKKKQIISIHIVPKGLEAWGYLSGSFNGFLPMIFKPTRLWALHLQLPWPTHFVSLPGHIKEKNYCTHFHWEKRSWSKLIQTYPLHKQAARKEKETKCTSRPTNSLEYYLYKNNSWASYPFGLVAVYAILFLFVCAFLIYKMRVKLLILVYRVKFNFVH